MVTKNLPQYATEKWEDYIISVTEASKSQSGIPLVTSDEAIYCFDRICKDLFQGRNASTSTDGLQFRNGNIELVEFKSGFKQRVTKERFDPERGTCKKTDPPSICEDYWNTFWELQEKKRAELIESIKLKAIESYILLEKHVFPKCANWDGGKRSKLTLTVVVDEDGVDGIEDILAEAAETNLQTNNCLSSIRQSLLRLVNQQDANGNSYFYDHIQVFSSTDFLNYIKLT